MTLSVDIEKRLGDFLLRVRFEADNGVLAFLGPSGSGKSMTLKCIAGIEKPDRGRIVLNGRVLFDSRQGINLPPRKRRVGYLFQQYALFPNMTVLQNIRTGIRARNGSEETVREMIRTMGLEGLENHRPAQLSGGQQQRAALARILVNEPECLLLDEPFSALDSHLRLTLERQVQGILRSFGKPVILVSHGRDEVYRLSNRVAILNNGHVEQLGSREDVFAFPRTRAAAVLTGLRCITPIEKLDDRRILAKDWNLELETAVSVTDETCAAVRSILQEDGPNSFSCRVSETIRNPGSCTVLLAREHAPGLLEWETVRAYRPGEALTLRIPPEGILLLKEDQPC